MQPKALFHVLIWLCVPLWVAQVKKEHYSKIVRYN